ncbi:hypothetical protein GTG28_12450 [Vibrio sp. OCN044]|uniref:CENP-V/GFA domain-containing protein n=1 Tax=Vibrio tetraodonis subsp. pristinus TaxID=2695891 RepID=A0A6L8LW84_9VIBR|nr:GFA family protein [Vibrio tetraodonis]MYM60035.1 hypothetical protein [Vibrio tetraodonis subsp. pristinus]
MEIRNGSCGCGSLKYQIEGDPINSVFCYCKECQKTTGSDKWFGTWIPKNNFKIIEGSPLIYSRQGDSGKDLNLLFCPDCGVNICAEVTVGNFYSVAVSTIDDIHNIKPTMSIYTASAPNWAVFPADVPKFDILPPDMGG